MQDQEPEPSPDAPPSLPAGPEPEEEPGEDEGDQQAASSNANGDDREMASMQRTETPSAISRCRSPGSREVQREPMHICDRCGGICPMGRCLSSSRSARRGSSGLTRLCAVCAGPYANRRCLTNSACPRNLPSRHYLFGQRAERERHTASSSSVPFASGDSRRPGPGREHPICFHLTAADFGYILHRSRECCTSLNDVLLLGAPRAMCTECDGQRSVNRRWFVDNEMAHVRVDCRLRNHDGTVEALECVTCFTLVDEHIR